MTSYELRWKVLSDLLVELRARGADIPPEVVRDLRLARSLIEAMRVSAHEEIISRLDQLLFNVESYLMAEAEVRLGPEEAQRWSKKLEEAFSGAGPALRPAEARFRPGLPRGEHWVRIRVSDELPRELLEELAAQEGVRTRLQPDGYLLVTGDRERVKSFMRKLAEHVRPKRA